MQGVVNLLLKTQQQLLLLLIFAHHSRFSCLRQVRETQLYTYHFIWFCRSADSPSSSSPASSAASCDQYQLDNVGTSTKAAASNSGVASGNNHSSNDEKVTIATQTGIEEADKRFEVSKLSTDPHCYECKVKYRDPRPKDLVMFLHAWAYSVSF